MSPEQRAPGGRLAFYDFLLFESTRTLISTIGRTHATEYMYTGICELYGIFTPQSTELLTTSRVRVSILSASHRTVWGRLRAIEMNRPAESPVLRQRREDYDVHSTDPTGGRAYSCFFFSLRISVQYSMWMVGAWVSVYRDHGQAGSKVLGTEQFRQGPRCALHLAFPIHGLLGMEKSPDVRANHKRSTTVSREARVTLIHEHRLQAVDADGSDLLWGPHLSTGICLGRWP